MLEKTHTPADLLLGALATVSVCVGGFCGSALAAFWKKAQGLLTGLLLGGLFAAALSGLLLMSGGLFDTPALLRMAAVLLCSCAGGVLGRALGEKKRRI